MAAIRCWSSLQAELHIVGMKSFHTGKPATLPNRRHALYHDRGIFPWWMSMSIHAVTAAQDPHALTSIPRLTHLPTQPA
jgi:hypothetical protein